MIRKGLELGRYTLARMPLTAGQTLSFYEILGPLGVGAMGEVYRAKDTRLDREVAIKVLPEHFAEDEERLRRFEREAKSLASLNHPNVAQIFGVDQVNDTCFLVLELVPGETLEDRIARGALPVDEAIDLCRQIAEGLEAAHEAGVIHRDLKPANVRITPDGKVKVLDFGLAKPSRSGGETESTTDSVLATEEGRLLGTPTYMAPEQARGKPIDRRVDVWAFGCVLFECLTARRAFEGETVSDVMAAVLQAEPDWSRLPADTPAHVRALLARCLEKDARRRQRDMGDAWLGLEGAYDPAAIRTDGTGRSNVRVGLVLAAVSLGVGVLVGVSLRDAPPIERPRMTHSALPLAHGLEWEAGRLRNFAVAPDGESVVYCSTVDRGDDVSVAVLAQWRRSEPGTKVLWEAPVGTTVDSPVFSPDGDWILFNASLDDARFELQRVSSQNPSEVDVLCTLPAPSLGQGWSPDGTLYFGTLAGGIHRLGSTGVPEPVTTPDPGVEWLHRSPVVLPDGETLLYVVDYEGLDYDVRRRSLVSGEEEVLISGARWVRFVAPDLFFYAVGETLWADGFEPHAGRLAGTPVRLPGSIPLTVGVFVDASQEGTLVYSAPPAGSKRSVRWVHRDGAVEETGLPRGLEYNHVAISPEGAHAVFGFGDAWVGGAVRVWDLTRNRLDPPLVSEMASHPVWQPDGERVVWYSADGGFLYRALASGGGVPEKGGVFEAVPLHVSRSERVLFRRDPRTGGTGVDLFLARFDADTRVDREPLVSDPGAQRYGVFSRDETKLAYVTTSELGMDRVFVTRVPVTGPGKLATPYGGNLPRWSRDGSELFYSHEGNLLRITVTENGDDFEFSEPDLLHTGLSRTTPDPRRPFDVHPDGQRVLVLEDDAPVDRPRLFLVTNLIDEVRALMRAQD